MSIDPNIREGLKSAPDGPPNESFQIQGFEIADVSLPLETLPLSNYLPLLPKLGNRTQDADGSIPFSSTILLVFFSSEVDFETIGGPITSNSGGQNAPFEHGEHTALLRDRHRLRFHVALDGHLARLVAPMMTVSIAPAISPSAGRTRSTNRVPASDSDTLRVVR